MEADLTILGGGPAGFRAALRAREYGFKTFLIEKEEVGGVCLHRGCIPTKCLLTDVLFLKKNSVGKERAKVFQGMLRRKSEVVSRLHSGMESTLRKSGVAMVHGRGELLREHLLRVNGKEIKTRFILIATGSRPKELPGAPFDGKQILTSDDLLGLHEIPERLVIIGAGPTGCEFASLYHALGTHVTLLEATSQLLPASDETISEELKKIFVREGMEVKVGEKVTSLQKGTAEKILVSIGRLPNSEALGRNLGILLPDGSVEVDPFMRTAVSSIYAVGDVTGKSLLAHVASYQAEIAVDHMAGKTDKTMEGRAIPECVFTIPEVAQVGLTEKKAREKRKEVFVGRSSFLASAKAHILEEKLGFVKLVGDGETGEFLGAHLLGPQVTELIAELTLLLQTHGTLRQLAETIHPHPTVSETVREAALDFICKPR
ncbi:MAG: dihydrolipoyl dehydrogenase [Candidatus Omnitrophica bacterium]|nr:dihydrolipoyl dehydrogenase [Candidatus Omnitrophota bacterium]